MRRYLATTSVAAAVSLGLALLLLAPVLAEPGTALELGAETGVIDQESAQQLAQQVRMAVRVRARPGVRPLVALENQPCEDPVTTAAPELTEPVKAAVKTRVRAKKRAARRVSKAVRAQPAKAAEDRVDIGRRLIEDATRLSTKGRDPACGGGAYNGAGSGGRLHATPPAGQRWGAPSGSGTATGAGAGKGAGAGTGGWSGKGAKAGAGASGAGSGGSSGKTTPGKGASSPSVGPTTPGSSKGGFGRGAGRGGSSSTRGR